jgi:hypothetical protein
MKEYRVVHLMSPEPVTASLTSAHLESSLNQEAREGWELKQFIIPPAPPLLIPEEKANRPQVA